MSEIKLIKNALEERLKTLLTRAKSTQASARLYPLYQQLQTRRFMTKGASEGMKWPPLSKEYEAYKKRRYGGGIRMRGKNKGQAWKSWPGNGKKMLIATSTLAGAVIGPGAPFEGVDKHRALFKPGSMQISVATGGLNAEGRPFDYPSFVAERRPFMAFSNASRAKLKDALKKYLIGK